MSVRQVFVLGLVVVQLFDPIFNLSSLLLTAIVHIHPLFLSVVQHAGVQMHASASLRSRAHAPATPSAVLLNSPAHRFRARVGVTPASQVCPLAGVGRASVATVHTRFLQAVSQPPTP